MMWHTDDAHRCDHGKWPDCSSCLNIQVRLGEAHPHRSDGLVRRGLAGMLVVVPPISVQRVVS